MEFKEMQSLWENMSQKVDQQKIVTDKLIIDMSQERYTNRLRVISTSETIGTFICFVMAIYITIYFNLLDVWYLQLSGIITISSCIILPILSLKSIQKMKAINISKNTFKQSLIAFTKGENRFMRIQKVSFYVSFLVLISSVIVLGKIMKGVDVFTVTEKLNWLVPSGIGVLFIFTLWVQKKYKKVTASMNNILKELES